MRYSDFIRFKKKKIIKHYFHSDFEDIQTNTEYLERISSETCFKPNTVFWKNSELYLM